jgi:hypothetical protein
VTAPTDRRLVLVALAVFAVTVLGLLVWHFRAQLVAAVLLFAMGRFVYRRAFPPRRAHSRRGGVKSLREWVDVGLLALIAYRLPARAKREKISTQPTPVYAMRRPRDTDPGSQLGPNEPWPEDLL